MDRPLNLKVPEEIYRPLAEAARQAGRSPEDLIVLWLSTLMQRTDDRSDPLEPFIGAFHSDIPDWTDQHDQQAGFVRLLR